MSGAIRVANGSGFWGDSPFGPLQLMRAGGFDVLTLDYLAEVTLSILTRFQRRDPRAGYAADFVEVMRAIAPLWKGRPEVRIVTNAGGVNPAACVEETARVLREAGLAGKRIAVVTGDDLMPHLDAWLAAGEALRNSETGEPLAAMRSRLLTANAYIGYRPVAEALRAGADLVLAGRVTDPAMALGPAVAAHGWDERDWDRLAGATVAGHLIECGCQVTGGIATDWLEIPDPAGIGFPIVEIAADGSCIVTKPPGTGGRVDARTVKEQLVYEIGDPREFRTPDVTVDFTSLAVEELEADRVRVSGARGRPPGEDYKVSAAYLDGYMASGELTVVGARAEEKARRAGEAVLERLRRENIRFDESAVETLGGGERAVLRIAVRDADLENVRRFSRELASLVTAGPPGTTGYAGGRPRPREVVAYWPAFVARSRVDPLVRVDLREVR